MNSYSYANGAIKSLENKILNRTQIFRLATLSKDEMIKSLFDAGYGTVSTNLEDLITSEQKKTIELITLNTPNKDLTDLFFISLDSMNFKILFKQKMFGVNAELGNNPSTFDNNLLVDAVLNGKTTNNIHLDSIVKEVSIRINKDTSSRKLSMIIDQVMFDYSLKATKLKSRIMYKYYQTKIDFINLLTLVRIKNLNWNLDDLEEMLLNGGTISLDVYKKAFNLSDKDSGNCFKPYYNEKLVNYYNMSLSEIERKLDELLLSILKEDKNNSESMGPIIYFYLEKCYEEKNIRIVFATPDVELNDLIEY